MTPGCYCLADENTPEEACFYSMGEPKCHTDGTGCDFSAPSSAPIPAESDSKANIGIIVGGVVGACCLLVAISLWAGIHFKMRRNVKLLPVETDELSDGAVYMESDIVKTLPYGDQTNNHVASGGVMHMGSDIKTLPDSVETNNHVFN